MTRGRGLDSDALASLGTPFCITREGRTGPGVHLAREGAEPHAGALTFASERAEGIVAAVSQGCEGQEQRAPRPLRDGATERVATAYPPVCEHDN